MTDQPNTLTPDQVNAIVRDMDDPRYPAQIGVFCDDCNLTFKGDFIVTDAMDAEARHGVARAHLRGEGWSCTADGDLCPKCAALRTAGA